MKSILCSTLLAVLVSFVTGEMCKPEQCLHMNHTHQDLTIEQFKQIHDHPDPSVCKDMTPRHPDCRRADGSCIQPQDSPSPYTICIVPNNGTSTQEVKISCGNSCGKFTAVYAQAREGDKVLGHFENRGDHSTFTLNCFNGDQNDNTIMFFSRDPTDSVTLTWVPPPGNHTVRIFATIAESYEVFWVAKSSPLYRCVASTGKCPLAEPTSPRGSEEEKCNNTTNL